MKKFILTVVAVGLAMAMVTDASAGIFGWRRCRQPVYVQPAPATARADQGYRTYSYQPAAPTVQYRTNSRSTGGRAYESAINKSLGRGF